METTVKYSEEESRRFGLHTSRFSSERIDEELLEAIEKQQPDLAIVRVPTSEIAKVYRFEKLGIVPIVADTLVYYRCPFDKYDVRPVKNPKLEFRLSNTDDAEKLDTLTGLIFYGYKSHYTSNKLLNREAIENGYKEWAMSFLEGGENLSWIVHDRGFPVAFANCKATTDDFEGVLYGVHSFWRGMGIYGDLINFTQAYAKDSGYSSMLVSTQIDDIAVQKSWINRGFVPEKSVNTIHLNLFMKEDSAIETYDETIELTDEVVSDFAGVVHDFNPLHFDTEYATKCGFNDRIGHGALLLGIISKVLGTRLPGEGTIYLHQNVSFLRPAYLGRKYNVRVALRSQNSSSGKMVLSTRVFSEEGTLILSGFATVLNKSYITTGKPARELALEPACVD